MCIFSRTIYINNVKKDSLFPLVASLSDKKFPKVQKRLWGTYGLLEIQPAAYSAIAFKWFIKGLAYISSILVRRKASSLSGRSTLAMRSAR